MVQAIPIFNLDHALVSLTKLFNEKEVEIHSYIGNLIDKIEEVETKRNGVTNNESADLVNTYENSKSELDKLVSLSDAINSDIRIAKSRLADYKNTEEGIEEELKKNKVALKLKSFGADQGLDIAKDICPSCHQQVDDSLLLADTLVQPMSINENIKYLVSQRKMILNYIDGLNKSIRKLKIQSANLFEQISEKRAFCLSLKKDLKSFDTVSESEMRLKIQLETRVEMIEASIEKINHQVDKLKNISMDYKNLKENLSSMPLKKLSNSDFEKLKLFQSLFRSLASNFGYGSASPNDIEINLDTLFPYLSGIELREVNTDIKSDSSASDFVRLIWAYLLSIYLVSNNRAGKHVGLIVFDEPAQHSMGVGSINSLLQVMASQKMLQSIVAASFDESDQVFSDSVKNVKYNLISIGDKLLRKC